MDQETLLAAGTAELAEAAEAYQALVGALIEQHEEWQRAVSGRVHASGWQGPAADPATRRLDTAAERLRSAERELALVRDTLREAAESFGAAKDGLRHHGPYARATDTLADAQRADLAAADRLCRLAARARDGRALEATAAETELQRQSIPADALANLLGRTGIPGPHTPPDRIATWWRSLDPAEQQRLTLAHPELIGSLDGLPARDRDRANRLRLTRLLDRPGDLDPQVLTGLRAIQRRLAAEKGEVLLLGLGTEGRGRGILCFGDPDRADDVAVYVPGFGTRLSAVGGGDADRAARVRAGALACGQGRSAAAMVWLGYDPPPNEGLDPRSLAVTSDAAAKAGADDYGRFLSGLRAARTGPPAHITAIGHSYGSLLVGQAAQRPGGFAADDVILVGSPGTGAGRADQLGVGRDHVYVGAADCDPVGHLPRGSSVAAALETAGPLGAVLHPPDELWFGQDPAGPAFGAHRFHVAPGDPANAFASHSAYFDLSSESLTNISLIVANQGTRISH